MLILDIFFLNSQKLPTQRTPNSEFLHTIANSRRLVYTRVETCQEVKFLIRANPVFDLTF